MGSFFKLGHYDISMFLNALQEIWRIINRKIKVFPFCTVEMVHFPLWILPYNRDNNLWPILDPPLEGCTTCFLLLRDCWIDGFDNGSYCTNFLFDDRFCIFEYYFFSDAALLGIPAYNGILHASQHSFCRIWQQTCVSSPKLA